MVVYSVPTTTTARCPRVPSLRCRRSRIDRRPFLLLEVAALPERVPIHDVRNRAVAVQRVVARDRLPPVRSHTELLGEKRHEDLSLLLSEAGELLNSLEQLLAGRRLGPHPGHVAVVLGLDQCGELLQPSRHRAREPVNGRWPTAQRLELVRIGCRDCCRVQRAEPAEHLPAAPEGVLHSVLLIQHHAEHDCERVLVENLVSGRLVGDLEAHCCMFSRAFVRASRLTGASPPRGPGAGSPRTSSVMHADRPEMTESRPSTVNTRSP